MPLLSAVLALDPSNQQALVRELSARPHLSLGQATANRVPVVVDTATRAQDKAAWRALEQTPGVLHIDLVFADFSDLVETP